MKKKLIIMPIYLLMLTSCSILVHEADSTLTSVSSEDTLITSTTTTNKESSISRNMEYLNRGLTAVSMNNGNYLSWRLFSTDDYTNQAFDIYRNGKLIYTTTTTSPTNYMDVNGDSDDYYQVVRYKEKISGAKMVYPISGNSAANGSLLNNYGYLDINFDRPEGGTYLNVDYDENKNASVNSY